MKHLHYSTRHTMTNPDTSKYPRYEPYLMYENNWVILDTLQDNLLAHSNKYNFDLCLEACNRMNAAYNEAMERQRKQVMNDFYFTLNTGR